MFWDTPLREQICTVVNCTCWWTFIPYCITDTASREENNTLRWNVQKRPVAQFSESLINRLHKEYKSAEI